MKYYWFITTHKIGMPKKAVAFVNDKHVGYKDFPETKEIDYYDLRYIGFMTRDELEG